MENRENEQAEILTDSNKLAWIFKIDGYFKVVVKFFLFGRKHRKRIEGIFKTMGNSLTHRELSQIVSSMLNDHGYCESNVRKMEIFLYPLKIKE